MKLEVGLKKSRGSFQLDIGCTITEQRTGLFGPSGSGKSTIMSLLAGLEEPDSGHIRLNGKALYCSENNTDIPPDRRRIGVVFQHAHLFPHLNVKKNLFFGWKRTNPEERKIQPDLLFKALSIENLLDRNVVSLSGGERQRVALARTILACPQLILMDEPLTGLDDTIKYQIIPYINRVLDEFSIPLIFISHSLMEMRLMTDTTLVMKNGRIENQTSIEQLARSSWADSQVGYINILKLGNASPHNDLFCYDWNGTSLILTEQTNSMSNLFELDSREILLFRKHPEATSARNLLTCKVLQIFSSGNRVRVELQCGKNTFIAQVVPESVKELNIEIGSKVVAAIKASVFKKIL